MKQKARTKHKTQRHSNNKNNEFNNKYAALIYCDGDLI